MTIDVNAALVSLYERERVASVINQLFVSTDARDWTRVRACFAPAVVFDMTSLAGGAPARLTPDEIAGAWEQGLAPIESIHHQTGNVAIRVEGDAATASCYGIAYHYRRTKSGNDTRTFVGSYDFHLERRDDTWRIDAFRFNLKFIQGNRRLEEEPPA